MVGSSFFNHHEINSIVGKIDDINIISAINNSDLIFDLAAPNTGTLKEIKNFYKRRSDIIIPNMKKNSKFVFASTMNAYGIDEKRKKLKNYFLSSSIYASNKRFAEKYIEKLCKKNDIDTYILRLSEVHGKFQRASLHIIKLIQDKRIFKIPNSPAWITFIKIIKFAIINISYDKEKPGLYTLVCDDILWNELLDKLSEKTNTKAKYIINGLGNIDGIKIALEDESTVREGPQVIFYFSSEWKGITPEELKRKLESGDPGIYLGDGGYGADMNISMVNIRDGEEKIITEKLKQLLVI